MNLNQEFFHTINPLLLLFAPFHKMHTPPKMLFTDSQHRTIESETLYPIPNTWKDQFYESRKFEFQFSTRPTTPFAFATLVIQGPSKAICDRELVGRIFHCATLESIDATGHITCLEIPINQLLRTNITFHHLNANYRQDLVIPNLTQIKRDATHRITFNFSTLPRDTLMTVRFGYYVDPTEASFMFDAKNKQL